MSKNTVNSLAMLSAIWQVKKKDYIENFVPFIATLIAKKNYSIIETAVVCNDFEKEFGLSIPFHPMEMILTRARKKRIILKRNRQYSPVKENVSKYDFSSDAKAQMREQEKLISEIILYAKETHKQEISIDETVDALISFLQDYDQDIVLAFEERGLLPHVRSSKANKFIICSFIKKVYDSEPELLKFVVNIAVGSLMANLILYQEYTNVVSKLKGVCIYLDTRIIFRVLGIEGDERGAIYHEFLKMLVEEGARLKIFRHTYDEIFYILKESLKKIDLTPYDPSSASDVVQFFVHKNYTKLDVQRFINQIEDTLKNYSIEEKDIAEKPTGQELIKYQEDETKLSDLIVTEYTKRNPYFCQIEKGIVIKRDVDSISSMYLLRKGKNPKNLKEAGHLFLTTNTTLAFASQMYERMIKKNNHVIPVCLTDTFFGTTLWLQSPAKIFEINQRKIIADCYAALKPNTELIRKYVIEVDKLKNDGKIDENTYYLLRRDTLALKLLEEKTLGDSDNFDSSTLEEIRDEIKSGIQKDLSHKYVSEEEAHKKTREKLDKLQEDYTKVTTTIENKAIKKAKIASNSLLIILIILSLAGISLQIMPTFLQKFPKIRMGLQIAHALISCLSLIYGFNIRGFKRWVQMKFKKIFVEHITEN